MKNQTARDTKTEFLESTFQHLVKNGLENTSVRDLCKATGISSGSLYYWFEGGKDEIVFRAAQYGLSKVSESLFTYAYNGIRNLDLFFASVLDRIAIHKEELRLVYQVATSPVYGERMRTMAEDLKFSYRRYCEKLADVLQCPAEDLMPLVYIFISIILDYVAWDDYEVAKTQINYLYMQLKQIRNNAQVIA